ncbi:hypothetical protein QNH47_17965 [Virgibacillus halodenitrificans]|uniref:hypothetical protein n=1 Tax=Virgibacillus halodenitrificans TaxID=1482 RepID=UPI0024C022B5|nr:hypothetical protein [Virgibacillus halodenitrificans]WHX25994.1 hypothetical protein QNH47_17965 [Virgibacillus halodenitrificans]
MKLIRAFEADEAKVEQFLKSTPNVKKESLMYQGYVVEIDEKIEACFVLEEMEDGIYWLKQLFITQNKAAKLPVLLEAILTLAKHQKAKRVFVHSHQPVVDILLEALQFNPQKEEVFVDKYKNEQGNWWSYHVS